MFSTFEIEHKLILEYLYETKLEYTNSAILANIIGYSKKTVSKYIKEISDELSQNGGEIVSKRGHGYRINVIDRNKFNEFIEKNTIDKQEKYIDEYKQNVHLIIRELLTLGSLKTSHFMELLYINRNVISQIYGEVAKSLDKFNLKISRRSSQGVAIEGEEIDIRACIVYERYYFNNKTLVVNEKFENKFSNKVEIERIKEVIIDTQMKFNVSLLDDNSLDDLAYHLYIANLRNLENKVLKFDEDVIDRFTDRNAYYISSALINELNNKQNFSLTENEKIFTSIFFVANRTFLSKDEYPVIDGYKDCLMLTEAIINYISDINNFVQIRKDQELKNDLSLNITQLITQSEFHLYRPIVDRPSTQSLQAKLMAVQISSYLFKSYKFKLTEWQLYYLSTIIYPVFGRYNFAKRKGKAIIVSNLNKFAAKSIYERIERNFPNEFSQINILNLYELSSIDFDEYEYIFSSYKRKELPKLPKNIIYFYTDTFFDFNQKQEIRRKLVSNNASINNRLIKAFDNIVFKTVNTFDTFNQVITLFSKLNEKNLKYKEIFIKNLLEYSRFDDFPVKYNTMFLTPLVSTSKDAYISIIIARDSIKVVDEKINIFVLWDRGSDYNYSHIFENESFPNILYNVFSDHEVTLKLMEGTSEELIKQKAFEIQEAIIGNGASFR